MTRRRTALALLGLLLGITACSRQGSNVKLRTGADSAAYVLGMNVGRNLLRMDSTLSVDALCTGIRDAFDRQEAMTMEEAKAFYLRYVNHTLPEQARAYEEQFLADIARSNRSYARTNSGVTYTVEQLGSQEQVPSLDRDSIALRWTIRTADGTLRHSSYERGDTLRTTLRNLIPGAKESVKLIGKGGRIIAWLPSREAYGAAGNPEMGIEANATICCEIELVDLYRR